MSAKQESAISCLHSGFNCAQAVFTAFCEDYGLDKELALKVAGGLGGGCRSGEICGAASGAVLVVGMKHGQVDAGDVESKANCGAKTMEFLNLFRERNEAITCRDLLGVDTSTPEGRKLAQDRNLFRTICDDLVRHAVADLEGLGY